MSALRIVGILALLSLAAWSYSDGDRAGVITKLSYKGLFCKTWESSMNMGGMRRESHTVTDAEGDDQVIDTMVPNTFDFTVEDPSLVAAVQHAMETGKRVTIHYHQEIMTPCRSDTGYFVITVH